MCQWCTSWPWPLSPKVNRFILSPWLTCLPGLIRSTQRFIHYRVHKLISKNVHCDLDLWPLTSKINSIHPFIMVNMSAKFDEESHKGLVSIMYTMSKRNRHTHGRTERTTAALLYLLRNALRGDNKALFTRYVLTDMFQSRPKDILLIRAFTRYVWQSCLWIFPSKIISFVYIILTWRKIILLYLHICW